MAKQRLPLVSHRDDRHSRSATVSIQTHAQHVPFTVRPQPPANPRGGHVGSPGLLEIET
jgi:hypothetical protein